MNKRIINSLRVLSMIFTSSRKLTLAVLCGALLSSTLLAQETPKEEGRPQDPRPETPLSKGPLKVIRPAVQTDLTVTDDEIVFTSPGVMDYLRAIRPSDNLGWLSFTATDLLGSPTGAAIYLAGNGTTLPGQMYFDSGAHDNAALIFRTAPTGGTITERMRVTASGNVGIGIADTSTARLRVVTGGAGIPRDGVVGETSNSDGFGVYGIHNGVSGLDGAGVYGESTSSTGSGVSGFNPIYFGVLGKSTYSTGVYGVSNTDNGVGGFSYAILNGAGVRGENIGGIGVYGVSDSGTGVVGISNTGLAGRFLGNVQVTGTLTKGSGSFKIDHPLDPENKYLSHSFVESPDMMNIYNGNVTTDAKGQAVVMLPSYFTALNRDYRYQLTVIGQFAQAIVASEIKNNQFTIKTNKPRVKVSWQVTGIRQDAYANTHPIAVEEDKPAKERGFYLHLEAFGQPKDKAIGRIERAAEEMQRIRAESVKQRAALKP